MKTVLNILADIKMMSMPPMDHYVLQLQEAIEAELAEAQAKLQEYKNYRKFMAGLEQDARRYRYLREYCYDYEAAGDGDAFPYFALVFESDALSYSTDTLDAAIDAAMENDVSTNTNKIDTN